MMGQMESKIAKHPEESLSPHLSGLQGRERAGWEFCFSAHCVQTPAVARVASPPLTDPQYTTLTLAEWWASRTRKLGL